MSLAVTLVNDWRKTKAPFKMNSLKKMAPLCEKRA